MIDFFGFDIVIPPVILLAEDNDTDALLFQRACQKASFKHQCVWVEDGEAAITLLQRCLERDFTWPRLVLLDIKMPRKDGFEVLEWIRDHAEFSGVPVLMLTSSPLTSDQEKAHRLGASAFFTKPGKFEELIPLLHQIEQEWMGK